GQVIEDGLSQAVFFEPGHPYTRALIQASALSRGSSGEFVTVPGRMPHLGSTPSGCVFAPRCSHRTDECSKVPEAFAHGSGQHLVKCWLARDGAMAGR